MPDMERIIRQMEIDLADNDLKFVKAAFFAGQDHARKQVVVISAIMACAFVAVKVLG